MAAEQNVQTVQDAYAAFGRGDIATILTLLTDDVQWQGVKGAEGAVPQAGERRGKAAVQEFFRQVAENTDFQRFEPREFIANDDTVVAIGYYAATSKPAGRPISSDWVMVFNFRDGRVARFREFTDSAAIVRAFQGAAV